MASSAGTVFVDVLPNLSKFAATAQAEMSAASGTLTKSATAIGATIGLALGAGAVAILGKSTEAFVELGGEVRSLQRVTGLAAEDASKLLFITHDLGIDSTKTATALGLLAKNVVANKEAFTKWGIVTHDSQGNLLGLDQILANAADRYVALGGGIKGTALALGIFGKSGKALIPILALGSAGIAEFEAKAEDLGVVLSETDVEASRELAIAQRELGTAFTGLSVSVGREIVPAMTQLTEALTFVVEKLTAIPGPAKVIGLAFLGLTGAIVALVKIGRVLKDVFSPMAKWFADAAKATVAYIAGLFRLAAAEGVAAAASSVLAGAMAFLSGPILPVVAGLTALAAILIVVTREGSFLAPTFEKMVASIQQLDAAARLSNESHISFANALSIVQKQAAGARITLEQLHEAEKQSAEDATKLAIEVPAAQAAILDFALHSTSALKEFADVSGQSVEEIGTKLVDLSVTSGKTVQELRADVESSLTDMKSAWADFKASIVDALGGSSSALEQFLGKTNVDLGRVMESLKKYGEQLRTFRQDFVQLGKDPASKQFLQFARENGLQALGIMESLTNATKKQRDAFFESFNKQNQRTQSLAGVIAHTLVPKFDDMIQKLEAIANLLGAHYTLKLSTEAAVNALAALELMARRVINTVQAGIQAAANAVLQSQQGKHGEHGLFLPGAATGGFVTSDTVLRVGEHSKPEMILPLQDARGIEALTKALEKAGAGGGNALRIIQGRVDLNTGEMRVIAREEDADELSFHRALRRMQPA